jgi:uncharacterized protein
VGLTRNGYSLPVVLMAISVFAVAALAACEAAVSGVPWQRTLPVRSVKARIVVDAAKAQKDQTRFYDPAYVRIGYPGGDVLPERGVCADVVVRAFRHVGLDLQQAVHEDMRRSFSGYPKMWGLAKPDPSIDHRRVPNLMTYFDRKGKAVAISDQPTDYHPGDVVAWRFTNGLYHIGVVSDLLNPSGETPKMVHNVGAGVQIEDTLFQWKIIGHYRVFN